MYKLIDMLAYCRPEGSTTQQEFCDKYLKPVFGSPDGAGNYIRVVGHAPTICFASHHDTVHKADGMQDVILKGETLQLPPMSTSSCLGADCTTGVWLQLEMIRAGIEGVYVCHAAEEVGCIGSRAVVDRNPRWLQRLEAVISFDRKGTESVITHQMGLRTASDEFAVSLADILKLPMRPDDTGSFTDSNEYSGVVAECTNLSVGYYRQHSKAETQDAYFVERLRDALIAADWSQISISRDPTVTEYKPQQYAADWLLGDMHGQPPSLSPVNRYGDRFTASGNRRYNEQEDCDDLSKLVFDNAMAVADWLVGNNITYEDLIDELDLEDARDNSRGFGHMYS
tara:strand:- start:9703 stop:10722 length:1020 start_codon:yes stop_codon:yes gene_type:complete